MKINVGIAYVIVSLAQITVTSGLKVSNAIAQETSPVIGNNDSHLDVSAYAHPSQIHPDGSAIPAAGSEMDLDTAKHLIGERVNPALIDFPPWDPGNLAVTYVAPRDDYLVVIEKYIRPQAPLLHIHKKNIDPNVIDPNSFIEAMQESVDTFPNAKWYYICDDDNFVMVNRLRNLASNYNFDEYRYVGVHHGEDVHHGENSQTNISGWVAGGPGVLISHQLAREMRHEGCKDKYTAIDRADVKLAACAKEAMSHHAGAHVDRVPEGLMYTDKPSSLYAASYKHQAVALHHISVLTFNNLGEWLSNTIPA